MFTNEEMQRLADQLNAKHSPEVVRIINMTSIAAQLCPLVGHDMHETMMEAVRCYCLVHNIGIEQMQACAEDWDKMMVTLGHLALQSQQPAPAAAQQCDSLLRKYMRP